MCPRTNIKTLAKNLLADYPEKVMRRKKRKTRMATAKLSALHANAKNLNFAIFVNWKWLTAISLVKTKK